MQRVAETLILSNPSETFCSSHPPTAIDHPSYRETWSESIVMFHNPNALYPVEPALFPDITHIRIHEDNYQEITRPYEVMSSVTIVITPRDKFEDLNFS